MIKTLVTCISALLARINIDDELAQEITSSSVPAVGWDAVLINDNGIATRPIVFWEVVYADDVPIEAMGMSFVEDKPPLLEKMPLHPHFVGYQRQSNPSYSKSLGNYESFNEWG